MIPAWLVISAVAVLVLGAVVKAFRRGRDPIDLGAVSHQWIAENRLGSGQESRR
jgi:hypothetical protein